MSGDGAAAFFWPLLRVKSASQPGCLATLLEFLSVRLDVKPRAESQNKPLPFSLDFKVAAKSLRYFHLCSYVFSYPNSCYYFCLKCQCLLSFHPCFSVLFASSSPFYPYLHQLGDKIIWSERFLCRLQKAIIQIKGCTKPPFIIKPVY